MVHVHYLYNLQCVCVQNCQSRLNLRTQTDTNMYHSSSILSHIDCLTSTLHIHLCIRQQTCRPQTQQLPTHSTIHACTYTQHDIMRSYHFAKSSCVLFCKTWVHEIGLKSCNIYTHSATHYPRVSRNISTQVARARDFYTQMPAQTNYDKWKCLMTHNEAPSLILSDTHVSTAAANFWMIS